MPANTRAKKFRPPLKSNPLSPALSSAPQSQESTATGDSLPGTQTHTVLSYCDNYEEQPSNILCEEQPSTPLLSTPLLCKEVPRNEDTLSSSNNSCLSSASEEIEDIEQTMRFKRHKRDRLPVGYGYGILKHNKKKNKTTTVADLEQGIGGRKCVRIATPLAGVEGKRPLLCGRDLSVYDYQSTPPEAGGVARRQAVDVSGYCRSREEQVMLIFPQHSIYI